MKLSKKYHWKIGGEFLDEIKTIKNHLQIQRLTKKDIKQGKIIYDINIQDLTTKEKILLDKNTLEKIDANHLILISIDTRKEKLSLKTKQELGINCLIGKETSRNIAHIIFNKKIPREEQKQLKQEFNKFLKEKKLLYNDLFLTNYRDNNRKRISFYFAYKLYLFN